MSEQELEKSLVQRAKSGDAEAFQELVGPSKSRLYSVVQKMIGHPEDTDDVVQEALAKAWNGIGSFKGQARFSTWVVSIASRAAVDFLRAQKRWRAESQVAYANLCANSEDLSGEVMASYASPEFSYEVREHIAYCFSCVGRSLPPDELAALVLRDVVGMSAREAAAALGVSDSVLRHRLTAARSVMQEQYEGLCALVSKKGICHQCKGLQMIAPDDVKGGPFPDIADFADRCAVVRDCGTTSMQELHKVFWRRTKEIEDVGLGSTEPDSGCGEDTE
ncbi:RNA polymerase sigma factor [Pelagibius sp. Alg239-R121]|uniref:RNA polymerase sigma factor n=1 Tax=Pelagibius sp. Alg239-R121 TaxID=2993448 RepID=UPI0024A638F3|nr:RNA polymerase sigma factor [Pelagibius sp. Alg239-R121]